MAVLKVAKLGNPVLRQLASPVSTENIRGNKNIQTLIDDMIDTMRAEEGVGLAAPQVCCSLQIVVLECVGNERYPDRNEFQLMVLINPAFTQRSEETVTGWEGCLSLPGLRGMVRRVKEVTVEAYNRLGEKITIETGGFLAIALQHEIDHLYGTVYIDRMADFSQLAFEDEFKAYWAKGEAVEI